MVLCNFTLNSNLFFLRNCAFIMGYQILLTEIIIVHIFVYFYNIHRYSIFMSLFSKWKNCQHLQNQYSMYFQIHIVSSRALCQLILVRSNNNSMGLCQNLKTKCFSTVVSPFLYISKSLEPLEWWYLHTLFWCKL